MEERIKIVSNGICINIDELKKIIIDEWQSGDFYDFYYTQGCRGEDLYKSILGEVADSADALFYATERDIEKKMNLPGVKLDWFDLYPKSDVRSIGFEVLNFFNGPWGRDIEEVIIDDIPVILEFLDTPPGKSLEAWDKWEKYWDNLDYPARRKKLLENTEQ